MSFVIGMAPRDTEPISLEVYKERLAKILERHPKAPFPPTEGPEIQKQYDNVFVIPGGTLSVSVGDIVDAGVIAYAEFSDENSRGGFIQLLLSLAAIADRLSADLYWYLDKIESGREEIIVDDYLRRRTIRPTKMGCGNGDYN